CQARKGLKPICEVAYFLITHLVVAQIDADHGTFGDRFVNLILPVEPEDTVECASLLRRSVRGRWHAAHQAEHCPGAAEVRNRDRPPDWLLCRFDSGMIAGSHRPGAVVRLSG